jgi:hypothetical protein
MVQVGPLLPLRTDQECPRAPVLLVSSKSSLPFLYLWLTRERDSKFAAWWQCKFAVQREVYSA